METSSLCKINPQSSYSLKFNSRFRKYSVYYYIATLVNYIANVFDPTGNLWDCTYTPFQLGAPKKDAPNRDWFLKIMMAETLWLRLEFDNNYFEALIFPTEIATNPNTALFLSAVREQRLLYMTPSENSATCYCE